MLSIFRKTRKADAPAVGKEEREAAVSSQQRDVFDALRARYRERDIEASKALGTGNASVNGIPISVIAGSLIAVRLIDAGERLGLSPVPEGRDLIRFAGLTACAIYASLSAKSAMDRSELDLSLDPDGLREGALSRGAALFAVLGDEWHKELSHLISLSSRQLFVDDAPRSANAEKFRTAVSSLGVLEMRAFERGAEEDRRQDQLAEAVAKMLFSTIR